MATVPRWQEGEGRSPRVELRGKSVLAVVNPGSGSCDRDTAASTLTRALEGTGAAVNVLMVGPGVDLAAAVRDAADQGTVLVVAAGGDGTVSAVAGGLAGSGVPLGIVPLGTSNVLARELGVPLELGAACGLVAGGGTLRAVDAMSLRSDGRVFLTHVGVGLDALMIRDTSTASKKRFGRLAYIASAVRNLLGFQPRRFVLTVDGATARPRATQVLVANCATLGQDPFRWGPDILPDDGVLNVCVIRARTLFDYARLAFDVTFRRHGSNPSIRYHRASREVVIDTKPPLPVQADGEVVGQTPVTVRLVAGAVRVVVPS